MCTFAPVYVVDYVYLSHVSMHEHAWMNETLNVCTEKV